MLTRLRRHKFWNYPYLSYQAVSSTWPKIQDKNLNTLKSKRPLRWNKMRFSCFEGLSLKQIKQIFLKGERRTLRKNGSRKIPPGKIPTHQTLHWKTPPGIFPPGIVPPFSLIAFLHLTLLFDLFTNVKVRKTKLWGLEELKMLFRNVEEKI